jgi:hypothetical protein
VRYVIEAWTELFSDEVEDMLFGMGKYETLPPLYTYVPSTKEVVDCNRIIINKIKTKKEFFEKYPKGVVWKL